jgi:hypothetical protein
MKNKMTRVFTMLLTVMLCMTAFSVNAFAYGGEETTPSPTQTDTPSSEAESKLLTPDGTGTVIDNVTNEDGKEFFTITTPSKHVFYLIIDRQKNAENVYFLDAVTEKDLLALAQSEGQGTDDSSSFKVTTTPEASASPAASTPTAPSDSQPEKQNSGAAVAAVALFAAVMIGVAVWFFKSRKPGKTDKGKTDPDDYDEGEDEDEAESGPDDGTEVPDEETECEDE